MRFVDEVTAHVRSGKGGDGSVSFLRERFRPYGGPDGGDGGRGGDVILRADAQVGTLLEHRYHPHHRAENGQNGRGRQKYGKWGEDRTIRVPRGTVVTDAETGEVLADLAADGASVVVAKGGRGGRGNMHFATATQQAPRHAEKGGPAVERTIRLTLKLLADVGLVGFPNAGKSTLISRLSAAHPKIADYPFTTLTPNLGIVRTSEDKGFCIADIPGLIGGAASGRGLGTRFLKHVERVSTLALILDVGWVAERHPVTDHDVLIKELGAYSPALLDKPRVIVLAKADLPDTLAATEDVRALAAREGCPFFLVSAVTGAGLDALAHALQSIVDANRRRPPAAPPDETDGMDEPWT